MFAGLLIVILLGKNSSTDDFRRLKHEISSDIFYFIL